MRKTLMVDEGLNSDIAEVASYNHQYYMNKIRS